MYSNTHFAKLDGYQTSTEILAAIEQVAGEAFHELVPGDTEAEDAARSSLCHRIWSSPTDAEEAEVARIAWTLADDDQEALHWGSTSLLRP